MHVTILGSEGFVGKNLSKILESKFDLTCSDILENGSGINYVKSDVRKLDDLKKLLKDTDVIIDLVANTLMASFDQIIENARVNIMGLLNILEAARLNDVKKIIFPSASSMIGVATQSPVPENHPALPKTAYGITKLASEHYLRIYKELYGIDFVIFRFFNIYGPHQQNGLIPSLIFRMLKNEPITIFGKGDQIRDYVFVPDAAPFFEDSILSNKANNKVVNMGTGTGSTVIDIVEKLSKFIKVEPKIEYKPERPGEISNFVADTNLLKQLFGLVPSTSLEQGLKKTVEWYQNQS